MMERICELHFTASALGGVHVPAFASACRADKSAELTTLPLHRDMPSISPRYFVLVKLKSHILTNDIPHSVYCSSCSTNSHGSHCQYMATNAVVYSSSILTVLGWTSLHFSVKHNKMRLFRPRTLLIVYKQYIGSEFFSSIFSRES